MSLLPLLPLLLVMLLPLLLLVLLLPQLLPLLDTLLPQLVLLMPPNGNQVQVQEQQITVQDFQSFCSEASSFTSFSGLATLIPLSQISGEISRTLIFSFSCFYCSVGIFIEHCNKDKEQKKKKKHASPPGTCAWQHFRWIHHLLSPCSCTVVGSNARTHL